MTWLLPTNDGYRLSTGRKSGAELTVSTLTASAPIRSVTSPATTKLIAAGRDPRLDIIRGIAMITMVVDHVTEAVFPLTNWHRLWQIPSPSYYGISSAAEIFVTLAGYMIGMVYLRKPDGGRRVLKRAVKIYVVAILTICLVTPFAYLSSAALVHYYKLDGMAVSPFGVFRDAAMLYRFPILIDVLGLYVIFMAFTPAAMLLARWKPLVLAAVSFALWAVLHSHSLRDAVSFFHLAFNPLAWQLLFFVPMLLGARRVHEPIFAFLEKHPIVFYILLGLMALITVQRVGRWAGYGYAIPWSSRYFLGGSLLIGNALLISFYASALAVLRNHLTSLPLVILASIGRNSLYCFAASIVATYALVCLWEYAVPTYAGYLAVSAMILAIVATLAWLLDRFTQRQAAREHASIV